MLINAKTKHVKTGQFHKILVSHRLLITLYKKTAHVILWSIFSRIYTRVVVDQWKNPPKKLDDTHTRDNQRKRKMMRMSWQIFCCCLSGLFSGRRHGAVSTRRHRGICAQKYKFKKIGQTRRKKSIVISRLVDPDSFKIAQSGSLNPDPKRTRTHNRTRKQKLQNSLNRDPGSGFRIRIHRSYWIWI
jgi:hypothetical protein